MERRSGREYCLACADAEGRLRPRADVRRRIAGWLRTWQAGIDEREAEARARHYMRAMPVWNSQLRTGRGGPPGRRGSGQAAGKGKSRGTKG
jgi:hypothetical protein